MYMHLTKVYLHAMNCAWLIVVWFGRSGECPPVLSKEVPPHQSSTRRKATHGKKRFMDAKTNVIPDAPCFIYL